MMRIIIEWIQDDERERLNRKVTTEEVMWAIIRNDTWAHTRGNLGVCMVSIEQLYYTRIY